MTSMDMQEDRKPYVAQNFLQTGLHGFGSCQAKSINHDMQREPTEQQTTCVLNRAPSELSEDSNWSVQDQGFENTSILPAQVSRKFWSAGDYEAAGSSRQLPRNVQNRMCIHPKFLHSNATSHKWPFGAVAELLDNAVDEIQNGATTVIVDKVVNPRNGSPALLIQDDGGGMDPDSLRRCMSFGFSDKQSDSSIGQYGNGFKTSTMRLGADAIVFSRCMKSSEPTQSVGFLSYTFLRETGQQDVIVPTVDYKYNPLTSETKRSDWHGPGHFSSNLSVLLKWSPFATEEELIQNFNGIGHHGTKILVFNLWCNDDGKLEFDFDTNKEDIIISGAPKPVETTNVAKNLNQKHLANQLHYSLRVYASILYLHLPDYFKIILRGQEVKRHYIANDLRYCECIKYTPQVWGRNEGEVVTTIGFLDGAPNVSVHGFNIYHKNRLILPFHRVLSASSSKGRGIAGVLVANFIKPTHDKQGFEKSSLYQKLETRLKEMTNEYWDHHCHLIGYVKPSHITPVASAPCAMPATRNTGAKTLQGTPIAAAAAPPLSMTPFRMNTGAKPSNAIPIASAPLRAMPVTMNTGAKTSQATPVAVAAAPLFAMPAATNTGASQVPVVYSPPWPTGIQVMRPPVALTCPPLEVPCADFSTRRKRRNENPFEMDTFKKQATHDRAGDESINFSNKIVRHDIGERELKEFALMKLENRNLREECLQFEEAERELLLKEQKLRLEIEQAQRLYKNLLNEYISVAAVKIQKQ